MVEPADRIGGLDRLAATEKRHDLFAPRVDGWSMWRVVRHFVQRRTGRYGVSRPQQNDARRSLWALASTLRLLVILAFPPKVDLMVKTQRSSLRMAIGDQFRDIYFDGLLTRTDDHFKMEVIDSPDFDRQADASMFPAHLNPIVFTFWGRVLGQLFPAPAGDFPARVSAVLKEEVGVDIPAPTLRMLISTVYWQARLFGVLLKRLRPHAVLVCDTGEYGLVLACRRAEIPIVELQHGVFDAAHPDAVPDWVVGGGEELVLPHILAARGRYWIEQLVGARQADIATPVGNELIDRARELRVVRRRELEHQGPIRRLLLTSQGMDSVRLAAWVEQLVAAAPPDEDWRLVIKLHPTYDAATTAFDRIATHPSVTIVPGDQQPNVFDLLAEADVHMSIASACLFEAAALDVPSLVIPLLGHEGVLSAMDGTLLRLASGPADVWTVLPELPEGGSSKYAEPGFLENMRRLIAGLHRDPARR